METTAFSQSIHYENNAGFYLYRNRSGQNFHLLRLSKTNWLLEKKSTNKLKSWDLGDWLDSTPNTHLKFYKDLAQRNLQAKGNRLLTFTNKGYFTVYIFDEHLNIEKIHKVANTVEYSPKKIVFYKNSIYLLLDKQLVVLTFHGGDFSSKHFKKVVYKTKAVYSDFAINHKGVFLFMKQAGAKPENGSYLLASVSADIEQTGAHTTKKLVRVLESSNLVHKYSSLLHGASFEYTGYSVYLLKHKLSMYGPTVLSYLNFDAKDLKSAAMPFRAPQTSSKFKNTEYFQTSNMLYYLNNKASTQNKEMLVTDKVDILIKDNSNQIHSKLIESN